MSEARRLSHWAIPLVLPALALWGPDSGGGERCEDVALEQSAFILPRDGQPSSSVGPFGGAGQVAVIRAAGGHPVAYAYYRLGTVVNARTLFLDHVDRSGLDCRLVLG